MSVISTRPARSGRAQELGLLSVALISVLSAWVLTYYGVNSANPPSLTR